MTKADIVNQISIKAEIERVLAQKVVDAFIETAKESLGAGRNIYLRGFGSFIIKRRATKMARNISKNSIVVIPEHFIPSFKPSETFYAQVKDNMKAK